MVNPLTFVITPYSKETAMGLVATLRDVRDTSKEELQRMDSKRPMLVDGSLSEVISRALNLAFTRKNLTTGDPYYGVSKEDGEPAMGGSGVPNIMQPDSPAAPTIRPSLESQQQDSLVIDSVAAVLADAVNANDEEAMYSLSEKPLLVYAIPSDGMVTEEMNTSIRTRAESDPTNIRDFVFVHTDSPSAKNHDETTFIHLDAIVDDYENKGARVFKSLESFVEGIEELRQRRKY